MNNQLCPKSDEGRLIKLTKQDIEAAHPLPQRPNSNGPPAVIVRFFSRDFRDSIIKSRKMLKGRPIVVAEDLTKENQSVLARLRSCGAFRNAWSWQGKLFTLDHNVNATPKPFRHGDPIPDNAHA